MPRRRSPTLTAELAALIKRLALDGSLMQHEIAARLNINQGRVSEVLTGKRFGNVTPAPKA
jgi:predicted XRE-type DNA-binding protein